MNVQVAPPSALAQAPSWQPVALPHPPLLLRAMDCTWA